MTIERVEIVTEADDSPDPSYLYQDDPDFSERRAEYENGGFGFMGLYAQAHLVVNGVRQTVQSAGLWGIEDDSDRDYLDTIAREECDELAGILAALGCDPAQIASAIEAVA
jgi:hypothetical protein